MSALATSLEWASSATLAAGSDHNPLLPEPSEIVVGLLAFLLLFWLLSKKVFPVFERLHNERVEAIEGGMQKVAETQEQADRLLATYQQSLQEARSEAGRIRADAQAERLTIIESARDEARLAAEQEVERARQRLEADIAATRQALMTEVGTLSVDLAQRVVGENLTDSKLTARTVDRFMADLEQQLAQEQAPLVATAGTVSGRQSR